MDVILQFITSWLLGALVSGTVSPLILYVFNPSYPSSDLANYGAVWVVFNVFFNESLPRAFSNGLAITYMPLYYVAAGYVLVRVGGITPRVQGTRAIAQRSGLLSINSYMQIELGHKYKRYLTWLKKARSRIFEDTRIDLASVVIGWLILFLAPLCAITSIYIVVSTPLHLRELLLVMLTGVFGLPVAIVLIANYLRDRLYALKQVVVQRRKKAFEAFDVHKPHR